MAFAVSSPLSAQSNVDTLQIDNVKHMTKLDDVYPLPGAQYQLHHFLAFISLPGIDPYAVYNHTLEFEPDLLEHIRKLTPGCKIGIQPFAVNSNGKDEKPIKFPRKDFYIK